MLDPKVVERWHSGVKLEHLRPWTLRAGRLRVRDGVAFRLRYSGWVLGGTAAAACSRSRTWCGKACQEPGAISSPFEVGGA
jgi:hypothetical protein